MKRAILVSVGLRPGLDPLLNSRPSVLLNIVDKPIIIHIIEFLIARGIQKFDFILHHFPEQIEEKLGDGSRWGVNFCFHLVKNPSMPFATILPTIKEPDEEKLLIGIGDYLPLIPSWSLEVSPFPCFYYSSANEWSGWGIIPCGHFREIPSTIHFKEVPLYFKNYTIQEAHPFLDATTLHALKDSNKRYLLEHKQELLLPTGMREVQKGVWLGRSVVIEPEVNIHSPVLIGENTQIRSGCQIGPYAIIENHCMIDNESTIENSLICQNSYVGEHLELVDCIVDRNALVNLQLGTKLQIEEEFLISASRAPTARQFFKPFTERIAAFILLMLLSPIYWIMRIKYPLKKEKKLRIPKQKNKSSFYILYSFKHARHFSWLPTLWNISKGELYFIGSKPRSEEELLQLSEEWRQLYLLTQPGMIRLADLDYGPQANEDERYASETFYATQQSFWFDLKLFLRWCFKK